MDETLINSEDIKLFFPLKDKFDRPNLKSEQKISINHVVDVTNKLCWNDFIKLVYSTYPIFTSTKYSNLDLIEKAKEYSRAFKK